MLAGAILVLMLSTGASGTTTTAPRVATPAPPGTAEELAAVVEQARRRFVAKDAGGVLTHVADNYRSSGFTKPAVRQQLLTLYSLYEELRGDENFNSVFESWDAYRQLAGRWFGLAEASIVNNAAQAAAGG